MRGALGEDGANVVIDIAQHLAFSGQLGYISYKFTNVSIGNGCCCYAKIPQGVALHFTASYFSSSGGILDAYFAPFASADGTKVPVIRYDGKGILQTRSEFYAAPTLVSNGTLFRSIGICGGANVGGRSSLGSGEQRTQLIVRNGTYMLMIKPFADASTVIFDLEMHEA